MIGWTKCKCGGRRAQHAGWHHRGRCLDCGPDRCLEYRWRWQWWGGPR
jgi:uncharacterized protein YndB with AHSA1/START domain